MSEQQKNEIEAQDVERIAHFLSDFYRRIQPSVFLSSYATKQYVEHARRRGHCACFFDEETDEIRAAVIYDVLEDERHIRDERSRWLTLPKGTLCVLNLVHSEGFHHNAMKLLYMLASSASWTAPATIHVREEDFTMRAMLEERKLSLVTITAEDAGRIFIYSPNIKPLTE